MLRLAVRHALKPALSVAASPILALGPQRSFAKRDKSKKRRPLGAKQNVKKIPDWYEVPSVERMAKDASYQQRKLENARSIDPLPSMIDSKSYFRYEAPVGVNEIWEQLAQVDSMAWAEGYNVDKSEVLDYNDIYESKRTITKDGNTFIMGICVTDDIARYYTFDFSGPDAPFEVDDFVCTIKVFEGGAPDKSWVDFVSNYSLRVRREDSVADSELATQREAIHAQLKTFAEACTFMKGATAISDYHRGLYNAFPQYDEEMTLARLPDDWTPSAAQ